MEFFMVSAISTIFFSIGPLILVEAITRARRRTLTTPGAVGLASVRNSLFLRSASSAARNGWLMIIDRVGDRLHWIGGAGDDMVPSPLPDVRAEEREELRAMLEKWKPFMD